MRKTYKMPDLVGSLADENSQLYIMKRGFRDAGEFVSGHGGEHIQEVYHIGNSTVELMGIPAPHETSEKERYLQCQLAVTSIDEKTLNEDLELLLSSIKKNFPEYRIEEVREIHKVIGRRPGVIMDV